MPRYPAIRAKIMELRLRGTARGRDDAALEAARRIDAEEVGNRAASHI